MGAKFLISRLSSLGDVVCSLPAASALKRLEPGCEVTWVVDPRFRAVVDACTSVDEVIAAKPGFRPKSWPRFESEFDSAFDLQGLSKSAIVMAKSRANEKFGYHWQREGSWLFSRPVLPSGQSIHIVDQYVDVIHGAFQRTVPVQFDFKPQSQALDDIERIRYKAGFSGDFIVVNAGAAWATKRWPPEHFASVIDKVAGRGVKSVMIGTNSSLDREAQAAVAELAKSTPIDLLGTTSVAQLIALISLCRAHVGGDTGSTHIAAALGKPAIGLYSITRPERSCPYNQSNRTLYNADSLAKIEPESVMNRLKEVLI